MFTRTELILTFTTAKYKYPNGIFLMVKVGLMLEDKRLEYRIITIFKEREIPFIIINDTIHHNGPVISDVHRDFEAIYVHNEEQAARRVISYFYNKERFCRIIVGVDPGPNPGLAVVGDGHVLEKMHLNDVLDVRAAVDNISSDYAPMRLTVRVGNGDIVNRNRIVNSLVDTYEVELVDEKNTTTTITNRDVEAAKNIAFTRGTPVRGKLNTVIREGYIRDIQRKSRIESNGLVTISRALAKKVAAGELSLKQAIELTRE